ncbi:hypothetical protein UFOVP210_35 [uncultured Caudovirales phage]|uniref:Uncharacterized protein n=1 Tax=uncultured Caudovirales phage TaxID=2100421 RepID=A0A6J7WJ09_9CAUD|nr:hypothetical protein UFOVP210_35 [uncultured Caudovirales phage]
MDRNVEMSVEAFCMAVGSNGSLLNQFVDEKWSVYLFAHYPEFKDGVGWDMHRGQLVVTGEPEHPALYTRKSLNKMFGTRNIKQFFDYYRGQWDAYRRWQDEQIEADEIEIAERESLDPVDLLDDGLTDDNNDPDDVVCIISEEPSAGIPPTSTETSWYGSPDGPYNQ